MSLRSAIAARDNKIDSLIKEFELEFSAFEKTIRPLLARAIRTGNVDQQAINAIFEQSGYSGIINNFISRYREVISNSRKISSELGINVVLPDRSIALLELITENNLSQLNNVAGNIVDDIVGAGLRGVVEEMPYRAVLAEMQNTITDLGRRLQTEAFTGISIFERTIRLEQFKEAGVKLYTYIGPLDGRTRDSCREVLENPQNETGFTLAEIAGLSVSITAGGGFNCRHDWVAYVPGVNELIGELVSDAQTK